MDLSAEQIGEGCRRTAIGDVNEIDAGLRALAAGLRVSARDPLQSGFAALDESGDAIAILLTPRETEVLAAAAKGMSNKEIGAALFITERTARTYVSNILGKLGLASRTQAALYALREGLASLDDGKAT